MLYLNANAFCQKDATFFQDLREAYLNRTVADPAWLRKVFSEPQVREKIVRFRNEVLDRFILYAERQAAFWSYQNWAPGYFGREVMDQQKIIALLRSLGGRKARLKSQPGQKAEIPRIESEERKLKVLLKIYGSNPRLDVEQWYWRHLMVLLYECLPLGEPANQRRKRFSVAHLCQWLSIPEIGLKCTSDVIKAARRQIEGKQRWSPALRTNPKWIVFRPREPIGPAETLKFLTER